MYFYPNEKKNLEIHYNICLHTKLTNNVHLQKLEQILKHLNVVLIILHFYYMLLMAKFIFTMLLNAKKYLMEERATLSKSTVNTTLICDLHSPQDGVLRNWWNS